MTIDFKTYVPESLNSPEQLPISPAENEAWQEANRSFWQSNPMRYDWNQDIEFEEFSEAFYKEIDRRFFSNVSEFMQWQRVPFDTLIDFDGLSLKDVLEIGVGNGSHAQLLATHAKSFTGIDLTDYAVQSTTQRMRAFNLRADIRQMDAESLAFEDSTFDFIWSWGVIDHSANTEQIVKEMHRVLKPGGSAITMVYHRGWWNYYFCTGILLGLASGDLLKTRSIHKTVQRHTDGAFSRYYTPQTWRDLVERQGFRVEYIVVKGSKAEVFPIPGGKVKNFAMRCVPNWVTRFLTNQCRMGSFLIAKIIKYPPPAVDFYK